ncbi:MAG: hypothetical protein ACYCPR_02980 [Thermoplasmataceae archaeon]
MAKNFPELIPMDIMACIFHTFFILVVMLFMKCVLPSMLYYDMSLRFRESA